MKKKVGILLSKRFDYNYIDKIANYNDVIFGYEENDDIKYKNKLKYICIKTGIQQQKMLENSFLVRLAFCVAYAEAMGCTTLVCTDTNEELEKVTYDVEEYIKSIQALIKQGTMNNINVEFPNVQWGKKIVKENVSQNVYDYSKCEVLFSGGIDCTVAAYVMVNLKKEIVLVNFKYGQSNTLEEQICCEHIKKNLGKGIKGKMIEEDLEEFYSPIKFSSGLLQENVILKEDNKCFEYVPFRNTIFFSICLYKATAQKIGIIVSGSQKDDMISPDNSENYYKSLQKVVDLQRDTYGIKISPVLKEIGGKIEVVSLGNALGVDYKYCWTCHSDAKWSQGVPYQCGICSDCATRYSAFVKNGIEDPLPYQVTPQIKDLKSKGLDSMENIFKRLEIMFK